MKINAPETEAHSASSNLDSPIRCRKCGNLTSRYRCQATNCEGILPIEGGCAPLEWMDAITEIQSRTLAATDWDRSKRISAEMLAEITQKSYARIANDQRWLAEHPNEDPSRLAWARRLRALARAGILPIYTTRADCGPKPPERKQRWMRR